MKNIVMALFFSAGIFSAYAHAADDHLHSGDIEIELENGQLGTHGTAHTQPGTGYAIYEGDFGDLARGPYATRAPGFDSHEGTFDAGDIIGYKAVGSLWSWSGTSWTNSVSNGETVKLTGNLGESTFWGTSGVTGDALGTLGQAQSAGNIHEHLEFSISSLTSTPTVGAYYITLQLFSATVNDTFDGVIQNSKYDISNPFIIVFNNGLSTANFEASVDALHVAAVPEPSNYAMLMLGLGLIGWQARRKA
jgi:hypothetical protein